MFWLTGLSSFSVLPPPPPRYTIPVAYAAGAANGMPVPVVETNNILSHPEGGCPLQVGEGSFFFFFLFVEWFMWKVEVQVANTAG